MANEYKLSFAGQEIDEKLRKIDSLESSGGVSSWNDLTDKPFYEEVTEITVIDNQTLEFGVVGDGEENKMQAELYLPEEQALVVGNTYTVTLDGVVYENLVCFDDSGDKMLGASWDEWEEDSTKHPFMIYCYLGEYDGKVKAIFGVNVVSTVTTHTVTIVGQQTTIKTLDPKYIKDMYGSDLTKVVSGSVTNITWGDDGEAVSAEFSNGLFELFGGDSSIEGEGDVALLTVNGVSRWCVVKEDENGELFWYLGKENGQPYFTLSMHPWWDGVYSDGEQLKCMALSDGYQLFGLSNPNEVTDIEFTIYNGTFKRIDEKYIPDSIARVGDAPILTSPSGKKFKLTVDDSGTVGTVEVTE